MTFEEFFTKKRIDLVALKAAEPELFAEFEKHFAQMGEKSFDHTKKYWFNKLRLQYHLAPEQKLKKIHQENQLAEQTIVETLTDTITAPTTGFKPRFKPGMASKPAAPTSDVKDLPFNESATSTPEVNRAAAEKDQNPPFKQEKAALQQAADNTPRTTDAESDGNQTQKPAGFKPRFNAKMTKGAAAQTKEFEQDAQPQNPAPGAGSEETAPKPAGFKPRFNMKTMAAKSADETTGAAPDSENAESKPAEPSAADNVSIDPKPAFKPRFNMKMVAPKEEETVNENAAEPEQPAEATQPEPEANTTPKMGFKPRFNAKTTKPQPPQE